jgi:hypothetical protein
VLSKVEIHRGKCKTHALNMHGAITLAAIVYTRMIKVIYTRDHNSTTRGSSYNTRGKYFLFFVQFEQHSK